MDDGDLDAELLGAGRARTAGKATTTASKQQKKRRKVVVSDDDESDASSESEDEEEEEEEEEPEISDDDMDVDADIAAKKRKAAPAKKRSAAPVEDDESDLELLEEYDGFDDAFMGDDEDHARLGEMGEVEKEGILAQRAEERSNRQETNRIRRLKNEARQSKRAAKTKGKVTRSKAGPSKGEPTAGKAALDSLVARKQAKDARQQQAEDEVAGRQRRVPLAYSDDEDGDDDFLAPGEKKKKKKKSRLDDYDDEQYSDDDSDGERGEKRATGGRMRFDQDDHLVASTEEISAVTLTRDKLFKWHSEPFFDRGMAGVFVRVLIGENLDSQQGVYVLGRVDDVVDLPTRPYKFGGENNNAVSTTKWLEVSQNPKEDTKKFKMREVSNAEFTPRELDRFNQCLSRTDDTITKKDTRQAKRSIKGMRTWTYKAEDVKELLDKKREEGTANEGGTREKERLRVEMLDFQRRAGLGEEGAAEKAEDRKQKLAALDDSLWQERMKTKKGVSMSEINRRNKTWSTATDDKAGEVVKERDNNDIADGRKIDVPDSFARRKTRPMRYFTIKGDTAADEEKQEDEGDDDDDLVGVNGHGDVVGHETHVPNLQIDLHRLEVAARELQSAKPGAMSGFGHTLMHLPPQSNLAEPPAKEKVISFEQYKQRMNAR